MREIDERIVDMQFNNKQFESGIQTSLKSLDNLKKGLDLESAAKGLTTLEKIGRSFSLDGISHGVEAISGKFSALGVIGVTALQNITNSVVNTGKRMVSALTIDPIRSGLSEYETKIGAIQTILTNTASKGTKLEDVNKTLNELNEYADKTIYNFGEMTRNIGTFTAAGIDLKTSATAIKGIANLAAGSGSTSQQASTAMYQLSQALAAGSLKLQDWNSVVNAGMGGELFKKALIDTGKELGKTTPKMENFRDSLQKGWITTEVLTKTLEKFASDESLVKAATQVKTFTQLWDTMQESVQSGWAQSWEYIIGDKDEATEVLTAISQGFEGIIGASSEARNETLKFWKDNGGRALLIKALGNAFQGLESVIKPVKEAFQTFFPPTTGLKLLTLTNAFKEFTDKLKIGEDTADKIKRSFSGLFAVADLLRQALSAGANVVKTFFNAFAGKTANNILDTTARIGDFLVKLNQTAKETDIFNTAFARIQQVVTDVAARIKDGFDRIKTSFEVFKSIDLSPLGQFTDKVGERFKPLTTIAHLVRFAFDGIVKAVQWAAPWLAKLGGIVATAFGKFGDAVRNSVENMEFSSLLDLINTGLIGGLIVAIKKFVDFLHNGLEVPGGFLETIKGILEGVQGSLEAFQNNLKAKTLMSIATSVAILVAALIALSLIDSAKLMTSLAGITVLFAELSGAMIIMQKTMGDSSMSKVAGQMVAMSAAILILSIALKNLSGLNWGELAVGLVGVGAMMAMLVVTTQILSTNSKKMLKGSAGLIALGTALLIMSQAVKSLSSLKWGELAVGLAGFAGILTAVSLAVRLMGSPKRMISIGIGLNGLASSMLIFAAALKQFAAMQIGEIVTGLGAMSGVLAAITLATRLMPKDMVGKATGVAILGGAMLIMVNVIRQLGGMPVENIVKGVAAMAGALGVIALAMLAMKGALPGAAALLVVSAALTALTLVLKVLGGMAVQEIVLAIGALAAVFVVIGIAALALGPVVPIIIALAGAIALLGVGVVAIGAGVLAFSAGLAALAVSGTAAVGAIVAIISALIGLIPMILSQFGLGILSIVEIITEGAPIIGKAITVILRTIIQAIRDIVPIAVDTIVMVLTKLLETLARYVPRIIKAGGDIAVAVINGIAREVPRVIDAGFNLVISFIEGLTSAMSKNTDRLRSAISGLVKQMLETAFKIITAPVGGALSLGKDIVSGIIDGIKSMFGNIGKAAAELGGNIISAVKKRLDIQSPSRVMRDEVGQYIVIGIAEGIKKNMSAEEAAAKKAENIINAFRDALSKVDLRQSTTELEHELWSSINSMSLTDANKSAAEMELLTKKVVFQQEKVELAKGEYDTLTKTFGVSSDKAQEAYNKYLREQITLSNLSNQIATMQKEEMQKAEQQNKDAVQRYYKYLQENSKILKELGYTNEEINKAALSSSGYNPDQAVTSKMTTNVQTAVTSAMGTVEKVYETKAAATLGPLVSSFGNWGQSYATALGDGFLKTFEAVIAKIKAQVISLDQQLTAKLKEMSARLQAMASSINANPTITPVLDLSNIEAGSKRIGGLLGSTGYSLTTANDRVRSIMSNQNGGGGRDPNVGSSSDPSLVFTQYNYSPKALSRVDIYRDTKNLISTVKGKVDPK